MNGDAAEQPVVSYASAPSSLQCVGCGYDLRAQDATQLCPECGTPVRDSIAAISILDGDPLRVSREAVALGLLVLGTIAECARGAELIRLSEDWRETQIFILVFFDRLSLYATTLFPVAAWLLTFKPSTRQRLSVQDILLRISAIAWFLAAGSWYSYFSTRLGLNLNSAFVPLPLTIFFVVMLWTHLRNMARSMQDEILLRHSPIVMWVLIASAIFAQSVPIFQLLHVHTSPPDARIIAFVIFAAEVYAAAILWRFRTELMTAQIQARDRWGKKIPETAPVDAT